MVTNDKINVITPVGDLNNLDKTISSVFDVANKNKLNKFNHILIFNNNILQNIKNTKNDNYELNVYNINPLSSRAGARNFAISKINLNSQSLVLFLDVGDILLPDPFTYINKFYDIKNIRKTIFKNKTLCEIKGRISNVPYYPIFLKSIVNPFMLSGVFISSDLIQNTKFEDEKKEDWIFWYNLLLKKPIIHNTNLPSYIYVIDNIKNHYSKKYNSFLKLKYILQKYFYWKNPIVYFIVILHFFIINLRWIIIRYKLFG